MFNSTCQLEISISEQSKVTHKNAQRADPVLWCQMH